VGRRQALRRDRRRRPGVRDRPRSRTSARSTPAPTPAPAKVFVFAVIDNSEGRGIAGRADPTSMFGLPRHWDRAMSFFDSRGCRARITSWTRAPEGGAAGRLSRGCRSGGRSKTEGILDIGLLVCDAPGAVSAARFTRSACSRRPSSSRRTTLGPTRCASSARTPGSERRDREPGCSRSSDAAGGGRGGGGSTARPRRPSRRPASSGCRWMPAASRTASRRPRAVLHAGGDVELNAGFMTTDGVPKARLAARAPAVGHRAAPAPSEGRGA